MERGNGRSGDEPDPPRVCRDELTASIDAGQRLALTIVELRAYVRRLVRNRSDAEDILQEIAVIALGKSLRPDDEQQVLAWCKGMARNVVAHFYRARRRRHKHLAEYARTLAASPRTAIPEDVVAAREIVDNLVSDLDRRSAELLRDRYILEETAQEIAKRTGVSAPAVRMKLMRLRRRR